MKVCVVMPAYNEVEGIGEFLLELFEALRHECQTEFVVVDDASSDETHSALQALSFRGLPLICYQNDVNLGHGASTIRALSSGLAREADVIISIDGDGQFAGEDVARLARCMKEHQEVRIVEGVRKGRKDPVYRRLTSLVTQTLVWSRCWRWPSDANTPLRLYRPETLQDLLDAVPNSVNTPNLMFSALARKRRIPLMEISVKSLARRGSNANGSTWGAGKTHLPTRRFIVFCLVSVKQWFTTRI